MARMIKRYEREMRERVNEMLWIWARDFDGGENAHANAEDMEAIRDFMTRNGYAEVSAENGRTTFEARC